MKRKKIIIIAAVLAAAMIAGCEETPDDIIVKEKNKNNTADYKTAEKNKEPIEKIINAPKHYKNTINLQDGKLVIDTDAEVFVPEAEALNTIQVKAKEINQAFLEQVTKAFFGDSPIYEGVAYSVMTKDEIQEKITTLKKYAAEGNLDPYDYGTDEEGNAMYDIYARITDLEEQYKTAPDTVEKKKVTPAFGVEYDRGDGIMEKDENNFMGVVETKEGKYDYMISKIGGESKEITFRINKIKEDIDLTMTNSWLSASYFRTPGSEENIYISEEELKEYAGISYEEAEKIAVEKVQKLSLEHMELTEWDYSIFSVGENGVQKDNIIDGGYEFYFTRKLDGVPVTYTMSYGGSLESMESTVVPWGYEVLNIIVGRDGIQKVEFFNPYEIGEVQKENVVLMDFNEIIKIYEQMMEVSNADISELEKQRTYHIKKIKLGYSRIYDPKSDNGSGVLVPVWDFFGGVDTETEDYSGKNSGEYSNQSFLTINAIDGTVIDRELGY